MKCCEYGPCVKGTFTCVSYFQTWLHTLYAEAVFLVVCDPSMSELTGLNITQEIPSSHLTDLKHTHTHTLGLSIIVLF